MMVIKKGATFLNAPLDMSSAACSASAIAPHAPLLRFRINVTGSDSVKAKIDYLEPDIEDEEEACDDESHALLESQPSYLSFANLPTVTRAVALWSTAREWINEYRSPMKRRAREIHKGALDLRTSALTSAMELKQEASISHVRTTRFICDQERFLFKTFYIIFIRSFFLSFF